MANNAMKPCPFCGKPAVFTPDMEQSVIKCGSHRCKVTPSVARKSFAEAQEAWNFRINEKQGQSDG